MEMQEVIKKLRQIYELSKELRVVEIPILQNNMARLVGMTRELLVALDPETIYEHPVDYE